MAWPRHHRPGDLDGILDALPDGYLVRAVGDARFVLGPTGAHVLILDDGQDSTPRNVALLASVIRSSLADQVTWVPFVHALLVTDRPQPCPPATRVPPALIPEALVEGPSLLRPDELRRLVASVEAGALDDLTSVAPISRAPVTRT